MLRLSLSVPLFAKAKTPDDFNGGGNQAPVATKFVTVKVLCASLGEGGETYVLGQTFSTTEKRAAALGELVEVIT